MPGRFNKFRPEAATFLLGASLLLAIWAIERAGALEPLELRTYDILLRGLPRDASQAGKIIIVGIDEVDIRAMNHYPISDFELAEVLERLLKWNAVAAGLDIVRDVPVPCPQGRQGTTRLESLLLANESIICSRVLGDGKSRLTAVDPPPVIADNDDQVGFVDFRLDPDGVLRRADYLALLDEPSPHDPAKPRELRSLPFLLACVALDARGVPEPQTLLDSSLHQLRPRHGGYAKADIAAENNQFMPDFRATGAHIYKLRQVIPHLLNVAAVDAAEKNLDPIGPREVEGKIVIVGVTAKQSVKDRVDTPAGNGWFGVEAHARLLDQFLRAADSRARPVRALPEYAEWLIAAGLCAAGALLAFRTRDARKYALCVIAGLASVWLLSALAIRGGVWMPVVRNWIAFAIPSIAVTAYVRTLEHRQRTLISDIFNRSVQKPIADELIQRGDEILARGGLAPSRHYATVLFTDLRGFTRLSEQMDPQELIGFIGPYMERMSNAVIRLGGMIVKYTGDGMMVVFGIPIYSQGPQDEKRHAVRAVKCALAMRKRFARYNRRFVQPRFPNLSPPLMMRIGIYSGDVVVGSVGNRDRLEFVTLGDTVNTASRLESMEKKMMDPDITGGGCRILIGESTYQHARQCIEAREITHDFILEGKQRKIAVFALIGNKRRPTPAPSPARPAAATALGAFLVLTTLAHAALAQAPAVPPQDNQETRRADTRPATRAAPRLPKYGSQRKATKLPGGDISSGTSRSDGAAALFLFAPRGGGLTTQPLPVVYWMNTRPIKRPIVFTLVEEHSRGGKTLLKLTLDGSTPGFHRIDLAAEAAKLKRDVALPTVPWPAGDQNAARGGPAQPAPGPVYRLSIGMQDNDAAGSANWTYARGTVARVDPPQGAPNPIGLNFLAANSLWFDAADALFRQLASDPSNPALRALLEEMIQSGGALQHDKSDTTDTPEQSEAARAQDIARRNPIPVELRPPPK